MKDLLILNIGKEIKHDNLEEIKFVFRNPDNTDKSATSKIDHYKFGEKEMINSPMFIIDARD